LNKHKKKKTATNKQFGNMAGEVVLFWGRAREEVQG